MIQFIFQILALVMLIIATVLIALDHDSLANVYLLIGMVFLNISILVMYGNKLK